MTDHGWVLDAVREHRPTSAPCVFIGGSTARGWANASSDIDVYVVGRDADAWSIEPAGAARPRVDVHELSAESVESLLDRVSWNVVRSGADYANTIKEREWLLLERLAGALVLVGATEIEAYQRRLAESAHRHLLVQTQFAFADGLAADCLGQLEAGDEESAVLSSHTAYLHVIDGLLAAHGFFSWAPKWRSRAMREATPGLVPYADYWQAATFATLHVVGSRTWARERVAAARDVMSRVDVLTFEVIA